MDLLAGYGSDSESEPGSPANAPAAAPAPAPPPRPPAQAPASVAALPAPSTSGIPLFTGLPAPAIRRKRLVPKFSCGINYGDAPVGPLDDDDDEEEAKRAAKRAKAGPGIGASLRDFLPAPKNEPRAAAAAPPPLGGGPRGADDDDFDDAVPGAEDPTGMFLGRGDGEPADEGGDIPGAGPAPGPAAPPSDQQRYVRGVHDGQEYMYDTLTGQYYYPEAGAGAGAAATAVNPATAALEAALAAEARGGSGIQFKEVSGAALRHMDPGQRAELNALRSALGDDYEARLKADAAKVGAISGTARRKHQLSSLYVQAKTQELEDLEKRASGAKTKAETARKYGW